MTIVEKTSAELSANRLVLHQHKIAFLVLNTNKQTNTTMEMYKTFTMFLLFEHFKSFIVTIRPLCLDMKDP